MNTAKPKPPLVRYGVAFATVVAVLLVGLLLQPLGEGRVLLITPLFAIAVAASTWIGGLRPGMLAAALASLLSDYFFTLPLYSVTFQRPADFLIPAVLFFVALLVGIIIPRSY